MARDKGLKLPSDPKHVQESNRRAWNEQRTPDPDFYTVGYMGRTQQEFIDVLLAAAVSSVVDIRFSPVSMYRPEFSKNNLRRGLEDSGIRYVHCPELGVPRDVRSFAIDTGSREAIWKWYDDNVATPYVGKNLTHFLNVADHPLALLCVEIDPTSCHRHRLVLMLEERGLRSLDL